MVMPIIRGMNKNSELSIDHFAPTIFLDKCNLKCPYCMNAKLVTLEVEKECRLSSLDAFIDENKSGWVVISGGEITCTPIYELKELIAHIRNKKCKIAITTNGVNPLLLYELLPIVNYVAMDIKCWNDKKIDYYGYCNLVKCSYIELVRRKSSEIDFDFEIRTTLYPPFVDESVLHGIGKMVQCNGQISEVQEDKAVDVTWYLQQFRRDNCQDMLDPLSKANDPYSVDRLNGMLKIAQVYVKDAFIRYV